MATNKELKQGFIDYLATLDKSKMSLYELNTYADLLRKADMLSLPGYADFAANSIPPLACGMEAKVDG